MADSVEVNKELIVAQPLASGTGYSWTLASRLGMLLSSVEALYGQRDRSFTILGIEFHAGVPKVWFPNNCGNVIVQLSVSVLQDPGCALFQLAHECVHLLDPAPGGTNNLEEGLATQFSLAPTSRYFSAGDAKYDASCALVRAMVAERPDAARKLREIYGPWRCVTSDQILDVCPNLSTDVANQLAKPF